MAIEFQRAVPVFRIYSLEKAREFYLDFLGFKIEWEHRFDADAPVFMQVSRGGLSINLSEHHGDGTPGSVAYVYTTGVKELHRDSMTRTTVTTGRTCRSRSGAWPN
jgi:catechol 2,3-dioxygenase-like lactoylglutathione lyase family enzyme